MNKAMNFQSIILELQKFWSDQGCLIWQPYYTQVGAGTYNPATSLRVLGPEPWNVAYVEPSIRPDDGRYGDNPNRFQQHYQFQVILKPDPGNPVEMYLNSLKAIGIDPAEHDIRFVEDNWTSPALGAWGLGWEVWLDGQEITQFTYFQQAGSMPSDPVAVEITYGLERIAIPLQRVHNFREIQWSDDRTYGDVNLMGEREHSTYYFDVADVDRVRQMYDLFESEAENCLAHGLVLPAHDNVLKCSHTFNILDSRGAVGVTERQALFSRMRDLSGRVAKAYYEQREQLEFPWMDQQQTTASIETPKPEPISGSADFVLEIGTEELPVLDLNSALEQVEEKTKSLLTDLRLTYDHLEILGTPRRIVVSIKQLAGTQNDVTSLVKGPPAKVAFDKDGKPTKAAIGFARGKNIPIETREVKEIDVGLYAAAVVSEKGISACEVLPKAISDLIASIRFNKSMRWHNSQKAFSRPVRWIVALHGDSLIPVSYGNITAGTTTRGLRFTPGESMTVASPAAYFDFMKEQGILLSPHIRKETIRQRVLALLESVNAAPILDEGLLDEVTNLVEAPTAMLGKFDQDYLNLPSEVLISVMKKHQRYFHLVDHAGNMLNYFIAVRNGTHEHLDIVIDGNEQVVKARFADATFFINEDRKLKLEEFVTALEKLTFQFKLGSMLDKTNRIEALSNQLLPLIEGAESELATIQRTAHLCKADLATQMVVEMTSLQGTMGKYYAEISGEPEAVANAIFEHYLPRSTGDRLPTSKAGVVVGLADRIDSITGLFAADLAPTGTKDPFAQRRSAIGIIQNLVELGIDFDLTQAISFASGLLPLPCSAETQEKVLEFIAGRFRSYLLDAGIRYDVVDAVLSEQQSNPASAYQSMKELSDWIARSDWDQILPAFSRCARITKDQSEEFTVQPEVFQTPEEKELYQNLCSLQTSLEENHSVDSFLSAFAEIVPSINAFFEAVLVMDEDPQIRKNRLGILQQISKLSNGCADFSYLEGF